MWYSKLLVAYDGSASSEKALQTACAMAHKHPGCCVIFVYALTIASPAIGDMGLNQALAEEAERVRHYLQDVADSLECEAYVKILKGSSPADMIIKCCKEEQCDFVVIGNRGKGGFRGYLGSVSQAVIRGTKSGVIVLKADDEEVW